MEKEIIQSIDYGERVTCNYAETYFNDEFCEYKKPAEESKKVATTSDDVAKDEWISPSDLLIGKLDLVPPFTSKITRGITHKGVLDIGDAVLQREREKFEKYLANLLADNDSAWMHIQEQEKLIVTQKVKDIYERIFKRKSNTMQKEMNMFYEDTLRDLEKHLRNEVRTVLISAHCSMISDLNKEINIKLQKERQILEHKLRTKYDKEVRNINKYYNLLLNNEKERASRLLNKAIYERNEALKSFCRQLEAENVTSTMYVMCAERKKCKMRQFLLQKYHSNEIEEKLKMIREKQDTLDEFNKNKKHIFEVHNQWEEYVKKVLQLFLKFIGFCLKLLPEQTQFLLDFEKLVVLQLNEIEKNPMQAGPILINTDDFINMFDFKEPVKVDSVCEGEPFVIEGDMSPSIPTPYGSRETLPSKVDLRSFRLQRQFIYAKCQKIEEVRAYLESQRCKCRDNLLPDDQSEDLESQSTSAKVPTPTILSPQPSEAPTELYIVDDIKRLQECPIRGCHDLSNRFSFPNLEDYLDFNEENLRRVQTILGEPAKYTPTQKLIDPKEIVHRELLFDETKEPFRSVGTQCESMQDITLDLSCGCLQSNTGLQKAPTEPTNVEEFDLNAILLKRKLSLKKIIHENPQLLKLFTEESFDFP